MKLRKPSISSYRSFFLNTSTTANYTTSIISLELCVLNADT